MILYVIRHGETAWNKVRRLQGQTDIPLAEEGIRLARETGIGMKDIPIDLVISSPLQRALQTANCITEGRNIPILTDERIQEISFGDWEGESLIDSTILPADYKKQFYENPLYCEVPPHGESVSQVIQRTADFYQSLLADPAYRISIFWSPHTERRVVVFYVISLQIKRISGAAVFRKIVR